MERELVRIPEIGAMTGLSRSMVYRLVQDGEIGPVIKIGRASRVRVSDVRDWIERQAQLSQGSGAA